MNEHALKILEFDKFLAHLAERATSDLGSERILHLRPSTSLNYIRTELEKVAELVSVLECGLTFPIRGVKDIRQALRRAEIEGSFLTPETLLDVASVLQTGRNIVHFMRNWDADSPHLKHLTHTITVMRGIEDRIHNVVNEKGEVRDNASAALNKIRKDYYVIRDRIQHKLNAIIRSEAGKDALQEDVITVRDNRFVLPVKSSFRGRIRGIIHDESASGATVFIEPHGTVEMNNELRSLALKEKREVEKILRDVTALIRKHVPEISLNLDVLVELDVIHARASYAVSYACTIPRINDDRYLCLESARHPLLAIQFADREDAAVVPLDIHLSHNRSSILITGPNTGGKTVALKTIGLSALMVQSGIPIPAADHTELPVFTEIFADIGDEQSIEQNLSTFSSHMTHIIEILETADEHSLVLMDEVGAGTDPDQGAALGMAILEELIYRGALTVATTHYGSLKAFAHQTKGMENACMAFDSETLQPTYHLLMGVPGSSKALDIAKRLGMPDHIIQKAATYLGAAEIEISSLITDLQEHARVMREKRDAIEQKEARLEKQIAEYTAKTKALATELAQIRREALAEADRIVREANKLVERTVRDLKSANAGKAARETAKMRLKQAREEIRESLKDIQPPPAAPAPDAKPVKLPELKPGQKIKLHSLQKEATVYLFEPGSDEVEVAIGNLRMRVPLADVIPLDLPETTPKTVSPGNLSTFDNPVGLELDIRGHTFDEAEWKIEKYLNDAHLAGLASVRIIHGKGTGALRRKVQRFLDRHPLVKHHQLAEPQEGGAGATNVELWL